MRLPACWPSRFSPNSPWPCVSAPWVPVWPSAIAWFSPSGKRLLQYGRQSYEELRRVVWPTKKETLNTTGLVMAFVVLMAFFLFICDKIIEWGLYDVLLRLSF